MRLAPEVLPVVSVFALCFVVVLGERTPLGLEVVEVKLLVMWVLVYQSHLNVSL